MLIQVSASPPVLRFGIEPLGPAHVSTPEIKDEVGSAFKRSRLSL